MLKILEKINIYYVVLFSLIVKLVVFFLIPNLEFPDSRTYMKAGIELFEEKQIQIHNVMPLQPIIAYLLQEQEFLKIFNIIISSLTIFLIYQLSLKLFKGNTYAMLAAVIAAIYPYFIFYSITGLTESLYIFLLLSVFLLLYNQKFFLASLVLVISILHRPILDPLAPILIFVFAFYLHQFSLKNSMLKVLQYVLVYIVLMFPWWLHQYNKYDNFVRLNLGEGLVWYAGNNPLNKSGGGVLGGTKGTDLDITQFTHIENYFERDKVMKQYALDFIVNNPTRFIELAGLKFIRFWRLWPYAPEYEKVHYIIISLMSYGVMLLLSIIFLIKYLKNYFRMILPILLLVGYFTIVHMILIASIRYRLPLEPFLIIFASYSLINIMKKREDAS
ncbi:MAG: hypothetical protein WCY75_07910 [Sulfurimonadaceae bacterium]|nr:hypothetical protein [Candidatus Cloacimonadota bacterium]